MESVKRVPVVQQVVENIKNYLFSGEIEIGQKLPVEKELCEQLGVGRGTVREAFRLLEATGYVELKPGKGAFAARTSEVALEDVAAWFTEHEVETQDFLEVRQAIEPMTVRLAVARCSEDEVQELKTIHEQFIRVVRARDVAQIALYDELFHGAIVRFSKNQLLISISKQVEENLKNFRSRTFYITQNAENAIMPHEDILTAFRKRDADAGELAMKRHLELIAEDLEKSKG